MRGVSKIERPRGRARVGWVLMAVLTLVVLATACGEDSDVDPVTAAQRRVSAAEKTVTEAQTAYDDATATFCEDTKAYITAIDRYGNVFEDDAATVGDVNTAGADLAEPGGAAKSSAEAVVDAREELAQAQQDLADAKTELAEVQSGTSAPAGASTTTTTAPLLPTATVDRVKQAESDLTAASEGITEQTPLTEAGEQFNSAAFALEVAWLRVLGDAGCLSEDEQSEAVTAVATYTKDLQTALHTAGYYDDPVDGVYGPSTVAAVEALQADSGLPETGYADRATAEALDAKVKAANGESATAAAAYTASVQSTLKLAGYWTGPVDGVWTPELTDAVKAFQTALEVPATGAVDTATLQALEKTIAEAKEAATTTTSTTTTPSTTTTD